MAEKYPKVRFAHCGGMWTRQAPHEHGSYFGYIDECQYLAGVVAGFNQLKSKKLGFIAASRSRRCCATSTPSRCARAR